MVGIFGAPPYYEVWNEPNLWTFGIGTPPADYLKYLRAAAKPIRDSGAKVISAGLAAYPDRKKLWLRNYSPVTWLAGLYAAGEAETRDYDLFGYHPYALTVDEKFSDPPSKAPRTGSPSSRNSTRSAPSTVTPGRTRSLRSVSTQSSRCPECREVVAIPVGGYGCAHRSSVVVLLARHHRRWRQLWARRRRGQAEGGVVRRGETTTGRMTYRNVIGERMNP